MKFTPHRERRSLLSGYFTYLSKRSLSERIILVLVTATLFTASLAALYSYSQNVSTTVPAAGGTLVEGMVGAPRFINPVLAITRVDQDLSALMYNSLLTLAPDGTLDLEAAESIDISQDGTLYRVTIKDGLTFSDGEQLTAEDVAFTIELIKNAELKSPLRGNWNEVAVELVSEKEINFVLNEAYAPFIENLTVGILPKHIWETLTTEEIPFSQYNTRPVGAGPYTVETINRNPAGLIDSYELVQNESYPLTSLIPSIITRFYSNETLLLEAFNAGDITSTGSLTNEQAASLEEGVATIYENPLPRVFGVFINQNRNVVLRDKAVREALAAAVDREEIIDNALAGFGEPTTLPVPNGFHEIQSTMSLTGSSSRDAATTALLKGGWKQNEETNTWQTLIDGESVTLEVTLATADNAFFVDTATDLKTAWEELGIPVTLAIYEQADIVQSVIRPRDYELLLFGTDVGRSLDLYPFWHSSQRDDPGLNVSLYTSITADEILETYRTTDEVAVRTRLLGEFSELIAEEVPAIFLYNPSFVYAVRDDVTLTPITRMGHPSDRFGSISHWYVEEESLWPIFTY